MKASENVKKVGRQMFLYLIVGAGATLVEWGVFYLLAEKLFITYPVAVTIAFAFSTLANWKLGRTLLFKDTPKVEGELPKIYLTSILGLLMNLLIMYIEIEHFAMNQMLSKVVATAIVFQWNFLIRKFVIYRV